MTAAAETCSYCGTVLAYRTPRGVMTFTKHDDAMCKHVMKQRIDAMDAAFKDMPERLKIECDRFVREIDKALVARGYPAVAEIARDTAKEIAVMEMLYGGVL